MLPGCFVARCQSESHWTLFEAIDGGYLCDRVRHTRIATTTKFLIQTIVPFPHSTGGHLERGDVGTTTVHPLSSPSDLMRIVRGVYVCG
jgi:hypothetical protein